MGTLYRVVSGEMVFSYDNVYILQQREGEVYILTYKTNAHSFVSISKLTAFTWLDYFMSHHTN